MDKMQVKRIWLVAILLVSAILQMPLFSQVVENIPLKEFQEFPQAEIKNFGIGSYGFDPQGNFYNPFYHENDSLRGAADGNQSDLYISLGGNFNAAGLRYSYDAAGNKEKTFENVLTFRPNFLAKFWYRYFMAQLSYANDYLLNQQDKSGSFTFESNGLQVTTGEQNLTVEKNTLLLAVSMLASPSLSLTLGAATGSFRYTWDLTIVKPAEFTSGLFNNLQYLFAANFRVKERWRGYLQFQTQKSNVSLPNGSLKLENTEITFPFATVSYYGNVGYGVERNVFEGVNISFEMRHQFLEVSDTTQATLVSGKTEKHIWNNELIAGTSFQPAPFLKAGALFSYFLKYDNNLDIRYVSEGSGGDPVVYFARIANPYSVAISAQYNWEKIVLKGFYQFSKSTYKTGDELFLKDTTHFVSINLGYNFTL